MRMIESQGKSIDAAIFNGLSKLEISIDEVEIEVVQHETKGILGIGAKPAIVRLTEKEKDNINISEMMKPSARENGKKGREPRKPPAPKPPLERTPAVGELKQRAGETEAVLVPHNETKTQSHTVSHGAVGGAEIHKDGEPRPQERLKPRPQRNKPPAKPQRNYTKEAAADCPAARFLGELIRKMGIEADISACIEDEAIYLKIESRAMGMLIGHRGENLDAMQYLTSLYINRNRKEAGYCRVTVDIEGYRDKREETLTRLARKVAAQVKASGRPRALEPMNPYERRILHSTLQNSPFVATHSEGEEPNRRVVISPKKGAF